MVLYGRKITIPSLSAGTSNRRKKKTVALIYVYGNTATSAR